MLPANIRVFLPNDSTLALLQSDRGNVANDMQAWLEGLVRIKVLNDGAPANIDAQPLDPTLEDAYLWYVGHAGV
jgi:hypothetical protein